MNWNKEAQLDERQVVKAPDVEKLAVEPSWDEESWEQPG